MDRPRTPQTRSLQSHVRSLGLVRWAHLDCTESGSVRAMIGEGVACACADWGCMGGGGGWEDLVSCRTKIV
jgi:hypothetical protein